jgi:putative transposase
LWLADITYLRTRRPALAGRRQDAYSRRIVCWSMADRMHAELVVDALQMGGRPRRPQPGLVHHSDQRSQRGFQWSLQHLVAGL